MRPIPIPLSLVPPGYKRMVFTGGTDLDVVHPAEGIVGCHPSTDSVECAFLIYVEDDDMERIQQGQRHFYYIVRSLDVAPFGFSDMLNADEKV